MDNIPLMKQNAENLRKHEQYEEALNLYCDLWLNHRPECDEQDGWRYAFCLRKLRFLKEAFKINREVYEKYPESNQVRNEYARCIFALEIDKDFEQIKKNEERFFQASIEILNLVVPSQYVPYRKTFSKVLNYLKSLNLKSSINLEKIITWTDKIDQNSLSTECFSFSDKNGNLIETSYKERWYSLRSKALFKLGRYQECMELCMEALSDSSGLRHRNPEIDFWYKYRFIEAKSKGNLDQKEKIINELKHILNFKNEWYIQRDISQLYFELGKFDDALQYAIDSALKCGKIEDKWRLFYLMGLILKSQSKWNEAKKHISLAIKLAEKHNGKIPDELIMEILELKMDTPSANTANELYIELEKYWNTVKHANMSKYMGIVKTILPNGNDGFITRDDGQDIYFMLKSFIDSKNQLQKGLWVSFNLVKSFDKKKNKESVEAINIERMNRKPKFSNPIKD